MKTASEIWVDFYCAAISGHGVSFDTNTNTYTQEGVQILARMADSMLIEYQSRYGDIAVIIQGIKTCFSCAKVITGEFVVSDGKDGEYKKFCAECVAKHKKGEEISNPGIALCVKCGQDQNSIFKCPEMMPPQQLTEELAKTLSDKEIEVMVAAEQDYRNKLLSGSEHTFK